MKADYRRLLQELRADQDAQGELSRAETPAELAAVAARLAVERGYDVTPEALIRTFAPAEGELSDAELHTLVGGKGSANETIKGDGSLWAQYAALFGATSGAVFNDQMDGGDGNDSMWGGYGDDSMKGGDGNDSMDGGWGDGEKNDGDDTMDGGAGDDTMWGGMGDDSMDGGVGNDRMSGNEDDDTINGGAGNDYLSGDEGDDSLSGDEGNDVLHGGSGDDTLDGGSGNDTLHGDSGNDSLDGGEGNDTLFGDAGNDTLTGGAGHDLFVFGKDTGSDVITDFNQGQDKFRFEGAHSINDIDVSSAGGKTFITYGDSVIVVEGVEMTADEVWARRG